MFKDSAIKVKKGAGGKERGREGKGKREGEGEGEGERERVTAKNVLPNLTHLKRGINNKITTS